jgi:hypothetical protein
MSATVGHLTAGNPALLSAIPASRSAAKSRSGKILRSASWKQALKLFAGVSWQHERTAFR